jgi:hypothetical protein
MSRRNGSLRVNCPGAHPEYSSGKENATSVHSAPSHSKVLLVLKQFVNVKGD